MKKRKSSKAGFIVAVLLMAIMVAVNVACYQFKDYITMYLCSTQLDAEARAEGETLATQIESEGIVLLENEKNSLPLKRSVDKVNVFGWSATQWIVGGSGSGRVIGSSGYSSADTGLLEALEEYEVEYNTELTDMYNRFQSTRPFIDKNQTNSDGYGALQTLPDRFSRLYEPSITDKAYYTDQLLSNAEAYSNTALVVLGRITGESNDCPLTQTKKNSSSSTLATDKARTYLEISTEEEALLKYVAETYDNVIVIINSINTMDLSFMSEIEWKNSYSCLLVGGTGINAANAIPKVLYGEVSPSGKTADTYAYDFSTNASYANSASAGVGSYTNSSGLYPANGTQNPNEGKDNFKYTSVSYLDYVEGIYVGYKWYETADAEGFWDSNYAKDLWNIENGYEDVVQYPFGYGKSYSQFDWAFVSATPNGGTLNGNETITITVQVTNVGNVPAKDVVQLYYTPVYNAGGIEKAHVNLCAFGKTQLLAPGASQYVTLTFNAADMASYDVNGMFVPGGGYVLEKGDYQVKLMTDSHTLATLSNGQPTITYRVGKNVIDPNGEKTSNLFTGTNAVDGVSLDGSDSEAEIVYLTRTNFAGSFPEKRAANRAMTDNIKALNLYKKTHADAWSAAQGDVVEPITNSGGDLKLYNSDGTATPLGLELGNSETGFDDPRWEDVLDQVKKDEMLRLTLHGYIHEEAIASVGKPRTQSVDGPAQVGSFNVSAQGVGYPQSTVLAQTWNQELSKSYGLALGKEAKSMGYSGLYAPGLNLHRSPFGGRNYEYYSEDSYLSGVMCANTIKGTLSMGIYTYIKHFVVYEQESMRDSMYHWMTEQTLREIYLKPFKIAIDDGGATAVMSAYGRVGAVWSGGSQALLTNLLRDEWGFKGTVITDYSDHQDYMNYDQMIRAGGDLWMDFWDHSGKAKLETTSPAMVAQMRKATKHILYMGLNAQYVSTNYSATEDVPIVQAPTVGTPWWIPTLIAIDVAILVICLILMVKGGGKKAKKKK